MLARCRRQCLAAVFHTPVAGPSRRALTASAVVARSQTESRSRTPSRPPRGRQTQSKASHLPKISPHPADGGLRPADTTPESLKKYFTSIIESWADSPIITRRLRAFGIPHDDAIALLETYKGAVLQENILETPGAFEEYGIDRLGYTVPKQERASLNDEVLSQTLFRWAAKPEATPILKAGGVSAQAITQVQRLTAATRRPFIWEEFPHARHVKRKIIMHVGPTNSGKTHNALRALAAAKLGIYAGPLRLLAYEIWERLNLGQIVPAGMPEPPPRRPGQVAAEELADSALDFGTERPAARRDINPQYARKCNMVTGEEHKIIDPYSRLSSVTIEMLSFQANYDVAVVDEIQMIADDQRGCAWTNAVLGLAAKELHLCGEDTAIPLVQELIAHTGDELVINRYERLTPLEVEKESLKGDFSKIRKGDCVVCFSRQKIFQVKEEIEKATGLRCAVVYGGLPPEVRSEQATLFNDPDSGYDVLVGSDAIGMGLNLKIGRVVFSTCQKHDGRRQVALSLSQTKQIAGRAGRYGLHGGDKPVGYVTTLREDDMEHVRQALAAENQPLQRAGLNARNDLYSAVRAALPRGSKFDLWLDALQYTSTIPSRLRYTDQEQIRRLMADVIDMEGTDTMRLVDITTFVAAPIGWRDPEQATIARRLLMLREKHMRVDLQLLLRDTGLLITLTDVERRMKRGRQGGAAADSMLMQLERLHKILSAYVWLGLRQPVQFCSAGEAEQLKHRVEAAMEWVLHALTWKGSEVADRAREVLDRRPVKQLSYEPHRMVRAFREGLGAAASTKEGRPAGRA
ncbi:P-loop containing nucleoside triphosphate hydrolase protein [Schizophyllum commune]